MNAHETNFDALRRDMVRQQLRGRDITDPRVLAAMVDVPREQFVPPDHRQKAHGDHPLPIGDGQTISQPYIVALMTQHLRVESDSRVLEIGAGSGYQTAILARLACEVIAVERIAALAGAARRRLAQMGCENVRIHVGDGTLGWPDEAPFDRILCAAASPDVPEAWIDQLADGGRIVAPIGGKDVQQLVALDKRGSRTIRTRICGVRFVPLIGEQGWPG